MLDGNAAGQTVSVMRYTFGDVLVDLDSGAGGALEVVDGFTTLPDDAADQPLLAVHNLLNIARGVCVNVWRGR
jgi:hypothetical protein